MDEITKVKLIYSGELIVIAIVLLVIGLLEVLSILGINDVVRYVFHFGTTVGSLFMIGDFIHFMCSKKRRAKGSLLDKCSTLPLAIYLIVIDTIMYINYNSLEPRLYQIFIGSALLYLAGVYMLQGIYHWFHPLQSLLDEIEQERINKITYKVLERKEDGEVIALHVETNKKYLFKKEYGIKEEIDSLFCLDLYPEAIPELYSEKEEDKSSSNQ